MAWSETVPQASLAAAPGAGFRRVSLHGFRSYAAATLNLADGPAATPVVLHGANGAGKTNILEALSWFAPGRGLRNAKLRDVQKTGTTAPWAVAATFERDGEDWQIGTGLENLDDADADRRVARLNGGPVASTGAFQELFSFLWLTPAQDRLFMEGASDRRRFLDRLTITLHKDHGRLVAAFDKAHKERAILLERGGADPRWLSSLEAQMAETAVAIAAARRDLVSHLQGEIDARPETAFPKADLKLDGSLEAALEKAPALEVEDAYKAKLALNRLVDAAAGRATEGPQRTDLSVTHRPKAMPARLASTGEQKALLAGIVLAQAGMVKALTGAAPLLLLDEIAAHLDPDRRAALFDALEPLHAQAWLTGTEAEPFRHLKGRAHFVTVAEGRLLNIV